MTGPAATLLPLGVEVPFGDLEAVLAGAGHEDAKRTPGHALTATLVVIGAHARLAEAATAVEELTDVGVRAILISDGRNPSPPARVLDHAVALEGLRADYLNNAVAALRLSSLPTVVWWRGGAAENLNGLAALADRLVLDAEDPGTVWPLAAGLAELTATSDLRWTGLTRWRALMAHFFDIPEVRRAAGGFTELSIDGADQHAARLYAGWLKASLDWSPAVGISCRPGTGPAPIQRIALGGGGQSLTLTLGADGRCVETAARVDGHAGASRVVSLGDRGLASLIGEELRIRSRDHAFERAVVAAQGVV